MLQIQLLDENAKAPSKGSDYAAGLDLYTVEPCILPPGHRALLKTGIAMAIPYGHVGLIWPRSKLAAKKGIDILAGVVDCDYRGEIMVSLLNTGKDTVEIMTGDKIAQMIIQEYHYVDQFEVVDTLPETNRGSAGINCNELRIR